MAQGPVAEPNGQDLEEDEQHDVGFSVRRPSLLE
jgi:hypothetical protein